MKKLLIALVVIGFTASCSIVKNDSLIKGSSIKSSEDVYITTIQTDNTLSPGLDYTIYIVDDQGIIENLSLLGRDKVGIKKCETPGVWLVSKAEEETEKVVFISDLILYRRPVRFEK